MDGENTGREEILWFIEKVSSLRLSITILWREDLLLEVFSLLIITLNCLVSLSMDWSSGRVYSPSFCSFLTNERGEKN